MRRIRSIDWRQGFLLWKNIHIAVQNEGPADMPIVVTVNWLWIILLLS